MERLSRIITKLDDGEGEYSVKDIVDRYMAFMSDYSLFGFMDRVIKELKASGKERTSETYTATLKSFGKYRDGNDIMLDCLDSDVMTDYQKWLIGRGLSMNSISFYNRILRAVYNRAADSGAIEQQHPFRRVYTGVAKTVKRALTLGVMKKIKAVDLHDSPEVEYARDMFLLSFYMRGMSFVDMAYLRKSDLRNGYVAYRRRKTGQLLMIKWTDEMQRIVDRHHKRCGDYLLPIIRTGAANMRSAYRNAGYNINRHLHQLGELLGLAAPLTMYVARHSWASAARAKGIPLSVISEGMGHDSEITTRIYLASIDTSTVDRANSLIIRSI